MTNLETLLDEATPGPWVVRETVIHDRKYGGLWIEALDPEQDDGKLRICISGSGGARSYTTRVVDIQTHDANDANARLIALTPQLAAALLKAREGLTYSANELDECYRAEYAEDHPDLVRKKLEAALASNPARATIAEIDALMGGENG